MRKWLLTELAQLRPEERTVMCSSLARKPEIGASRVAGSIPIVAFR
jgi:hypothetical protein